MQNIITGHVYEVQSVDNFTSSKVALFVPCIETIPFSCSHPKGLAIIHYQQNHE